VYSTTNLGLTLCSATELQTDTAIIADEYGNRQNPLLRLAPAVAATSIVAQYLLFSPKEYENKPEGVVENDTELTVIGLPAILA